MNNFANGSNLLYEISSKKRIELRNYLLQMYCDSNIFLKNKKIQVVLTGGRLLKQFDTEDYLILINTMSQKWEKITYKIIQAKGSIPKTDFSKY
jgi:hypothetical protein